MKFLTLFASAVLAAGCQLERTTSDGRPMPGPTRQVESPPGVVPNKMSMIVAPGVEDTSGNGFPDTILITVGLWNPDVTDVSVLADGEFRFSLYHRGESNDPEAEPIARWVIPSESRQASPSATAWGTGYGFRLNLNDVADDQVPPTDADLRGFFVPSGMSKPIATQGQRPVRLGRM